jgi:heme-degrading monooxygenase HmoA
MFLVIFRNRKRAEIDQAAYEAEAARMEELARAQPGYLSFKSYTAEDGEVVALSEWADEASARAWGRLAEHRAAQQRGRDFYYESYTLFACDNPRTHAFRAPVTRLSASHAKP